MNSTLAIPVRPQPDMLSKETLCPLHFARAARATGGMVRSLVSTALLVLCAIPAMNAQNIISTVAGGGKIPSTPLTADIPGPTATIKDSAGNLYIAAPFSANIFKLSNGVLTVWAGQGWGGFNADNIQVSTAVLGKPAAFAFDTHGNLYIADFGNTRIRKVNLATQNITTVAGNGKKCASPTANCGDNGPAKQALMNLPQGVAVDSAGNIFIADSSDNRIRRVDHATKIIKTVAGNGKACSNPTDKCGDGGLATAAFLNFPEGVAVDAAGNLYIADTKDHRIRFVNTSTGIITTIAGNGGACLDGTQQCGDGKAATGANLRLPQAITIDASGNFYIADTGDHRIRFVQAGIISTVAGNGTQGFAGDGGSATAAELDLPGGVYLDAAGNIIISDTGNQRIRQVDTTGTMTTLAGGGLGDNGDATKAILAGPYTVFEDVSGKVYFADQANNRIRVFTKGGGVSTVAGTGSAGYSKDQDGGPATQAMLNGPSSVVLDKAGNMYIADTNNLRIRKVDTTGKISTFAGDGMSCPPPPSICGDGGPATSGNLSFPTHVAFDSAGNLYIADYFAHKIRKVDTAGIITTVAGNGKPGYSGDGGLGTQAQLNHPSSVGADSAGNLYIADQYNNRIRAIDLQSDTISTYALNGNTCLCGDGGPAIDGSMWNPLEVSVDPSANVFVSGGNAKVVQRIDAVTGTWGTVAGIAAQPGVGGFSGDGGPATKARLASNGTSVDAQNNLYIADYGNNRIRFVHLTPDVTVSTTSLTFGNWPLNTTSTPLTVQLTSTGGVDLSLTGITITGASDFAETASCGNPPPAISLGVDSTCTVSVTFTPSNYARRTATLTFTDNGPTSPQTVSLAGSGPDFTISASPTTITVTRGNSGSSTLTLTPLGEFNQPINLTYDVCPTGSTCTIDPNPVQMDGINPGTSKLTIQTSSSTPVGTYTITVKGVFVPLQHPVTITLIVQ